MYLFETDLIDKFFLKISIVSQLNFLKNKFLSELTVTYFTFQILKNLILFPQFPKYGENILTYI